jgi:hypothetical protein
MIEFLPNVISERQEVNGLVVSILTILQLVFSIVLKIIEIMKSRSN